MKSTAFIAVYWNITQQASSTGLGNSCSLLFVDGTTVSQLQLHYDHPGKSYVVLSEGVVVSIWKP
jgi:hypothetical protein